MKWLILLTLLVACEPSRWDRTHHISVTIAEDEFPVGSPDLNLFTGLQEYCTGMYLSGDYIIYSQPKCYHRTEINSGILEHAYYCVVEITCKLED